MGLGYVVRACNNSHCLNLGLTSHLSQHLWTPITNTSYRDIVAIYILIKMVLPRDHDMENISKRIKILVALKSEYPLCFYEE